MTVSEIVNRVRLAIDEVMVNESNFFDATSDELNLTAAIIDKISYALTWVIENASQEALESGGLVETWTSAEATSAGGFSIGSDLMAVVTLPEDILRLVSARLSSWKLSPIPIAEQSMEYLMQGDAYARGSWDRPVTVLTHVGADRVLEMYSAKTRNDTLQIAFVRKPEVDTAALSEDMTTEVSVPERLEGALVYEIAGLVMLGYRDQVAASLLSVAKEMVVTGARRDEG